MSDELVQNTAQHQLVNAIKIEPLEDGILHPAEASIIKFIDLYGHNELISLLSSHALINSTITASSIRLLGRVSNVDLALRQKVVSFGLASPSIEIRDATVQAAELWGDLELALLLKNHRETSPWLSDYVQRVVHDLECGLPSPPVGGGQAMSSHWRKEPPTDAEVANPQIIAWQFRGERVPTNLYIYSAQDRCCRFHEPILVQVMFIGKGEPRVFVPGTAKMFYFRPFKGPSGELIDPGPDWKLDGFWRPIYAPSN